MGGWRAALAVAHIIETNCPACGHDLVSAGTVSFMSPVLQPVRFGSVVACRDASARPTPPGAGRATVPSHARNCSRSTPNVNIKLYDNVVTIT